MKRIALLILMFSLALATVGCDGLIDTTPTDPTDTEIENDRVVDIDMSALTVVDGVDISLIPEFAKKGVGTVKNGGFKLRPAASKAYCAEVEIRFFEVVRDDFADLVDYYIENGGTTPDKPDISNTVIIQFEWGSMNVEFNPTYKQILSTAYINSSEESLTVMEWPVCDHTPFAPWPENTNTISHTENGNTCMITALWSMDDAIAYVRQLEDVGFGNEDLPRILKKHCI